MGKGLKLNRPTAATTDRGIQPANSAAYTERALTFDSDGFRLVGVLAEPTGATIGLGAVLVHGWSNYRSGPHGLLVELARALAAAGIPALRFDLRGRGDSAGEYAHTDLDGMIADTVRAGQVLRNETETETETGTQTGGGCRRLAAVGLCSGGNVAIGAATLDPAFERLVPISTLPFQTHKRAGAERRRRRLSGLLKLGGKLLRPETWRKLLRGEVNFKLVGRSLGGESRAVSADGRNLKDSRRDIVEAFTRYKGEVLFEYGGADAEGAAGREHYQDLCRTHGIKARFHVIAGANHNFYSLAWKRELIEQTVGFLDGEHG